MYQCKMIADSIGPSGKRLSTLEITFPRIVLAEIRTHRMHSEGSEGVWVYGGVDGPGRSFSMNAASSRAIPVKKMLERVREHPFVPTYWGANQKGMQAEFAIEEHHRLAAESVWREALENALKSAEALEELGIHKQTVNRLIEPFSWVTCIVSATEWDNFLALRTHKDAQHEIRTIAEMMLFALKSYEPQKLDEGQWHLPYITEQDWKDVTDLEGLPKERFLAEISAARSARVSYMTQDGIRDLSKDQMLFRRLVDGSDGVGHFSPLEHPAQALAETTPSGNFVGWGQLRKEYDVKPKAAHFGI